MSQYSSPATYSISSIIRGKARVATASTIIQYISLYYFIVILTGNVLDQSVHKGPSERLRCSLNQITGRKTEKKNPPLFASKSFAAFFSRAKGGGETGGAIPQCKHYHLQATEIKTPQSRKKRHRFFWVFARGTVQSECES